MTSLPYTHDELNQQNPMYQKFALEKSIQSAAALLYYHQGGVAQKLIHELKYNGKKEIACFLGKIFAKKLMGKISADLILPIPIHNAKRKKRGYNQSEYFAMGLSEILEIEVKKNLIKRIVNTKTQTRKTKMERWENVKNIYSTPKEKLSARSVLVVDDVVTTGATVSMFCERLFEAKVGSIDILSIARRN